MKNFGIDIKKLRKTFNNDTKKKDIKIFNKEQALKVFKNKNMVEIAERISIHVDIRKVYKNEIVIYDKLKEILQNIYLYGFEEKIIYNHYKKYKRNRYNIFCADIIKCFIKT